MKKVRRRRKRKTVGLTNYRVYRNAGAGNGYRSGK
jgi:hypothetical protein